jgi:tripartite-type tricarboxylate transporter receptor subunit TctC
MKKFILLILAFIISTAYAFDGKEQTIKFIVPFAPGGGTDNAIRIYQKHINALGYNSVIEYKPGADGLLGKKEFLNRNDLSGYTLLVSGSVPMAHEDSFAKDKGWTINDFTLVSDIISVPSVVVSSKKSGITNFDILKQKVKSREQLSFAYGAIAGKYSSMILLDDLDYDPKKIMLVPYKGANPALADVIGGHADLVMIPIGMALPLIESDKVNVLYSDSIKRVNDIPTATELKLSLRYPGSWGVVLPKDVNKDAAEFYTQLFKKIASTPELVQDLRVMNGVIDVNNMGPKSMMNNYKSHMKLFEKFTDGNRNN